MAIKSLNMLDLVCDKWGLDWKCEFQGWDEEKRVKKITALWVPVNVKFLFLDKKNKELVFGINFGTEFNENTGDVAVGAKLFREVERLAGDWYLNVNRVKKEEKNEKNG